MTDLLRIGIEGWLSPEFGDPTDRATTAELKIQVGGEVATRLEDLFAKTVRDTARVSAYRLAYWFADNWWRLRWEPEHPGSDRSSDWAMSHRIGAAGGGYLWPDLTIACDGDSVSLRAAGANTTTDHAVRYLSEFSQIVSAGDYERSVDTFVGQVIARLADLRIADLDLPELWKEIGQECHDPALSRLRRLEAMLGCDADEGDEGLLRALNGYGERFGPAAIDEIAAAFKQTGALGELGALDQRLPQASAELSLPGLDDLRAVLDSARRRNQLPWQIGETLANAARRLWGLGSGPIESGRFTAIVGAPQTLLEPDSQPPLGPLATAAGLRNPEHPGRFRVLMHARPAPSMRFEFARVLADAIWADAPETLLPVTKAKTARQKMQRSFAGQFLCPYDELVGMVDPQDPDDDAMEQAAQRFAVSPLVVRTLLVNKGYRGRELLRV
jgi:hypothetical protein